jgi:glycine cleavage system H protein
LEEKSLMEFPESARHTADHEWIRPEGNGVVVIGITSFAQEELGEVVFVDLPTIGKAVTAGGALCVVESTKAASDVYAPVGGTVKEVNEALLNQPSLVNSDSYGAGWMVRLEKVSDAELAKLMTADQYKKHIGKA